ncbi:hypothetical protein VLK31_20900 [Variovorax sp. H27-G14]|uniref:hypothetical protein n=1 Tax=Variovorax sp. H27-G14 TaxID=3111914 RepID=UPI0038FBEBC3
MSKRLLATFFVALCRKGHFYGKNTEVHFWGSLSGGDFVARPKTSDSFDEKALGAEIDRAVA